MMNKIINKINGFTMIELLIVLAIISILALVSIPIFNSFSDDSKIEELKSVMLLAAASQEKYFASTGVYSSSEYALKNYNFPECSDKKMKLKTGVILNDGVGMSYWVNGTLNVNGKQSCWIYLASTVGNLDDSGFKELKPGDNLPYNGVECNF